MEVEMGLGCGQSAARWSMLKFSVRPKFHFAASAAENASDLDFDHERLQVDTN